MGTAPILNRFLWHAVACGFIVSGSCAADEKPAWRGWPLGDRFSVGVAAFKPKIDTLVRAVSTGDINPGAAVDFERDLGMKDSVVRPLAAASWRFAKRHSILVNYFDLDRSGDSISNVNIKFGDAELSVGLPVESYLDIETFEVDYAYSILFDRKKDLSIGLGISFQDIQSGIRSIDSGVVIEEDLSVYLPLPTLTAGFRYAFSDKLIGVANVGWLAVEAELGDKENLRGSIWRASASIRYEVLRNAGLVLGYSVFDIDVDYSKRDLAGFIDYRYHGPVLGLDWFF